MQVILFLILILGFLLSVVAETSTGCLLAGSSLGKRGKNSMKYTSLGFNFMYY